MRHGRRATRKLQDLPSLFDSEEVFETPSVESSAGESGLVAEEKSGAGETGVEEIKLDVEFRKPLHRLRFMSFGSGSSGNCSYVGTERCGVLIDAGVDNNFVTAELVRNGINLSTIKGILLTHDHGDHVRYCYALVRRNPGWKLFATPRTIEGILRRHNLSRRITEYHSPIFKEHEYMFDDIKVIPFNTSHDGADNMGYAFSMGDTNFVICTDTGVITERADYYLKQASAIMIESNYDNEMLTNGRYREYLKARIRSEIGHLDNRETARYIKSIYSPSITHLFLCHLSEENNTPETAFTTMVNALTELGVNPAPSSANIPSGTVYLATLPRYKSSDLYIL